ncbi:MAG: cation transporter [Myxococcales bacterium]|nr:cation transporter [Myxococcales bacterium]
MNAQPRSTEDARAKSASRLTIATVAGSLAFAPSLLVVHLVTHSQLALAQAADSLSDSLGGIALIFALRASARAADDDHPHGHSSAEPIGALVVAILVGTVSIEVLRSALTTDARPSLDAWLLGAFAAKIAFKTTIATIATRALKAQQNPAIDALRADALSDVLVCSLSVAGALLARVGWARLDSLLAVAVAIYIAVSAVRLARENVALLMGSSAPIDRRDALREIAMKTQGVVAIDKLVATFFGSALHVHVELVVDRGLSLVEAHEIGHAVERALLEESDVARAVVHVGPSK